MFIMMCGCLWIFIIFVCLFFCKQKTAYGVRISDWSSDVCSSDLWRLPEGGPATRGRPMINLLPLGPGETIRTVLPLPEDEESWKDLHVMFATANGTVQIGRASCRERV